MGRRIIQKIAHSFGRWLSGGTQAPEAGVIVRYSRVLDAWRNYVTDGLTFERLKAMLKAGDAGQLADTLGLFEELEEKDTRLGSVLSTRRLALTGLPWEIVSAAETQEDVSDKTLADEAASYCRETLSGIEEYDEALEHLALALGPNLSLVNLVWENGAPVAMIDVPTWRLTSDPSKSLDVRVITEEQRNGIPAPIGDLNWIVHIPNNRCGYPFKGAVLRACAMVTLAKLLAFADWATYLEKFGMPIRWGSYVQGTSAEEKEVLAEMLEGLGSNAWAMFSKNIEFSIAESSQRGTAPFEAFKNACDRDLAIAILGANLTVDTTGGTGTYAAGEIHQLVREDILDDDIRREGRTIRRQLLKPMAELNFAGWDVPVPEFRRVKPDTEDKRQLAELIEIATQRIGLAVPEGWARNRLGLPEVEEGEAVIARLPTNPFEFEGEG